MSALGVQYLEEGVSWTDVVGVKGVRDAKSPAWLVCEMVSRRSGSRSRSSRSLNGVVSYKACRRATSPCPVVGEFL